MQRNKVKKIILIIIATLLVLTATATATLLLAGGLFQPRNYLQPWAKTYTQRFKDPRIRLAAFGLLAANGHNMQPWQIKFDRNNAMVFYLYADPARMSPMVDPYARQLMITQGTFLEYVAVAGRAIGYPAKIDLFPNGTYDEKNLRHSMSVVPVARISLQQEKPQPSPLFDALRTPDTNRSPYKAAKLTTAQTRAVTALQDGPDVTTELFQEHQDVRNLGDIALNGAVIEAHTRRVMDETSAVFRSNEYQKNNARYGFSFEGQGISGPKLYVMQGLITLLPFLNSNKAAADLTIQETKAALAHTPAYAMIRSRDNSRLSQVKSGLIYSRLNLTAASRGLAVQPVSQALEEYPEMHEPYTAIHHSYAQDGQTIQMLVRIGKPTAKAEHSMRRDVMDLVRK